MNIIGKNLNLNNTEFSNNLTKEILLTNNNSSVSVQAQNPPL